MVNLVRRARPQGRAGTKSSVEDAGEEGGDRIELATIDRDLLLAPADAGAEDGAIEHLIDDVAVVLEAIVDDLLLARAVDYVQDRRFAAAHGERHLEERADTVVVDPHRPERGVAGDHIAIVIDVAQRGRPPHGSTPARCR